MMFLENINDMGKCSGYGISRGEGEQVPNYKYNINSICKNTQGQTHTVAENCSKELAQMVIILKRWNYIQVFKSFFFFIVFLCVFNTGGCESLTYLFTTWVF